MSLIRKALLAGSTNPWLRDRAMKTAFVRRSVSRFMPGEQIDDAIRAAEQLKPQGITTILTRLGENLATPEEFEEVTQHYLDVLDRIHAAGLDAHISVKPTQLGLDLDPALCERNLGRLIERAGARQQFVWIDMESSPYVDRTLALFRRMRARTTLVGVALQAYLYRTEKDLESLVPLGAAIRFVKGAYLEPPDIAFPKKSDVDENFFRLCTRLLAPDARGRPGALLHIATHDAALVDRLAAYIAQHGVPSSAFEFAMLYGIQRGQQARLAAQGRRVRVLISYGEYWFPWYMRRLAERPANVWFVLRTMFG
jgi:proline dehydrogenase